MAFDVTLQPMAINIVSPNEDELPPGVPPEIQLLVTIGMALPFQQGPGQPPVVVPIGNVRLPLQPSVAKQVGERLAEEGAKFPERPNIDIAQSLDGLDQAAQFERKIRGD